MLSAHAFHLDKSKILSFGEGLKCLLCFTFQGLILGLGLQHKTVEDLEKEIDLPVSQLLGLFTKVIRKMVTFLNEVLEKDIEKEMIEKQEITLAPTSQTLEEDLVGLVCLLFITG